MGWTDKKGKTMANYINRYFKDGVEILFDDWSRDFSNDLNDQELRDPIHTYRGAIYTDRANGRPCQINGHTYTQRADVEYESASEVIDHMLSYDTEALVKAIEKLPDDIQKMLVLNIERVKRVDDRFVVEDVKW